MGATWRSIAAWLAGLGHAGINAQNVTNFRKGAYAQWLKDQDKIDAIRDRAEGINREIAAGGYTALDKMIMVHACPRCRTCDTDMQLIHSVLWCTAGAGRSGPGGRAHVASASHKG